MLNETLLAVANAINETLHTSCEVVSEHDAAMLRKHTKIISNEVCAAAGLAGDDASRFKALCMQPRCNVCGSRKVLDLKGLCMKCSRAMQHE